MDLLYGILEFKVYFLGSYQKVPQNFLLRPLLLSVFMEQKGEIAPCQSLPMAVSFSSHNFQQRAANSAHGAVELGNKLKDEIQYNIK